ncbi:hypothetical protein [Gordonia terrae]|uniref:hypothetical protein n=1 Tax=Gordonia terrae TaxID=2055 RepID=UPI003F6C417D
MTSTAPTYQGLSQDQLAVLVPELLLSGQMIDRSGMAHLISAFGRDVMGKIAIEEWMAASPVYTHRMRSALGIDGDGVEDMFKCLQLDIGAPPQFMDFRYRIDDEYHGSFVLDHCGALLDVEPLGDDYVTTMCHDIEDPTFDATAIATNRRARIRPVHRPPRRPAGRTPHCEWTVTIEPDRDELPLPPDSVDMFATRAGQLVLSPIDTSEADGWVDYRGPLVEDLQFAEWSTSALVRVAEEVALQHQLLSLGFLVSLRRSADSAAQTIEIFRKQLIGIAGLAADRIRAALDLPTGVAGFAEVLALHPCFGPIQYTGVTTEVDGETALVRIPQESHAMTDGGWMSIIDVDHLEPLQAAATAVDPYLAVVDAEVVDGELRVRVGVSDTARKEFGEVSVARFSGGASFEFTDRGRSIPITPVGSSA